MEIVQKKDFVEIRYTGYFQGRIFDSNIDEDLKKIDLDAKPSELIIVVGEGMLVSGLDRALEGKEIGKEYYVKISPKEGFGDRNPMLVKTIPLKAFTEKNVNPKPGMIFSIDQSLVKIVAVSGARVIADFNNPMAGKEIEYKFKITKKILDERKKIETLFLHFIKIIPEFEIGEKIVVMGAKGLDLIIRALNNKFKELLGKELDFKLKE